MSKFEPVPIKRVLKNVIEQLQENTILEEDEITKAWNKAVSKKIKLHARPTKLKNSSLIVSVESSSWLFELQTKHKNKILKKLKGCLGEDKIRDIKFKIGETRDAA